MGRLRREQSTEEELLRVQHLIGRSARCHLCLDQPEVSGVHASLQWSADGWELRDLGSRNGTWLDGRRLAPGDRALVAVGAVMAFGSTEHRWQMLSDAAPPARAFPLDGGAPVVEQGGALSIPGPEDAEVLVFRDESGHWQADSDEGSRPAAELRQVRAGGRLWELDLPELDPRTPLISVASGKISDVHLDFLVSSDEEHVDLSALSEGRQVSMGSRAHHYLLLTLARLRARDQEARPADLANHGWTLVEELMRMLRLEETQLNLQIFRIRRQFAEAGFQQPQQIIERRRGTGQLRVGVRRFDIRRG